MSESDSGRGDIPSVERYGIAFTSERAVQLPNVTGVGFSVLLWFLLFVWVFYCFILLNSEPVYGLSYLIDDPSNFLKWGTAQQFWTVVFPLWFLLPQAGIVWLVGRDARSHDLGVLEQSRILLSPFDRQSPVLWMIGTAILTVIYLPLYAIKRRRLARIAKFTLAHEWVLTPADTARTRARQRRVVYAAWVLLVGCPVSVLGFLWIVFDMLSRLAD